MPLETYGKEIVSLLVPFITWVLNAAFRRAARLQFSRPHQFTFLVEQPLLDAEGNVVLPKQTVRTQSYTIQNSGRESATNVEVVFNWKPMCLNLWPVRHYREHVEQDGRYVLIFDSLAPGESIGLEAFDINRDMPEILTMRCAQCVGRMINVSPQPVASAATRRMVAVLLALGLATAVYFSIVIVQLLVLKTPLGH